MILWNFTIGNQIEGRTRSMGVLTPESQVEVDVRPRSRRSRPR